MSLTGETMCERCGEKKQCTWTMERDAWLCDPCVTDGEPGPEKFIDDMEDEFDHTDRAAHVEEAQVAVPK